MNSLSGKAFIAMILACLFLAYLGLTGCASQTREQTQTETQKWDNITVSGTLAIPNAEGKAVPMPVAFSVRRTGGETQEQTKDSRTEPDYTAQANAIAAALGPIISGATGGGPSLLSLLGGAGATLTAATTGYLALKKREQMRPSKGNNHG